MVSTVIFEDAARTLLVIHAVLGFTAVFTVTHHAAAALLAARGRRVKRQLQRFGWMAPAALAAQALFGLALYPAYRMRVRLGGFERTAKAAVQLFELKEHLSALALALVFAAAFSGRGASADAPAPRAVAGLSIGGAAMVWSAAIIGLYVTARQPVGMP
jgi:hypothetical protein